MEETKSEKKSLGTAIDEIINALSPLDGNSRNAAIIAVCQYLKIDIKELASLELKKDTGTKDIWPVSKPQQTIKDIRTLAEEKKPSSAIERATLVAYYLSEHAPDREKKDSIGKEDLLKYFKQAGFPLPKRADMTLIHAKNAGYLDAAGEGTYKINPVGYNLIAHRLPFKENNHK